MQRMMLIGPSQCGKTSLTQCLRGENIHYQKTQAIVWSPTTIDTPGEYLETEASTVHCWSAPAKQTLSRWCLMRTHRGHLFRQALPRQ